VPNPKGVQPGQRANPLVRAIKAITGPWTWHNLRMWVTVIGAVLVVRWAWFDQFRIPSASMEPTLHGIPSIVRADRVSINKLVYGLRFPLNGAHVPFTNITLPYANRRIWRGADPKRWEIVVFRSPEKDAHGKVLIKRVVGLPGERIHIADGNIHVNGVPVDPPQDLRDILDYTDGPTPRQVMRGKDLSDLSGLSDDEVYALLEKLYPDVAKSTFRYGILTDDEFALVPDDCYFMLGDNSKNSRDGRVFGWVPNERIMGRAFCIWWPISRWRDFTGFSQTWWGRLLIFGIPACLILCDVFLSFIATSRRVRSTESGGALEKGERLLVNRLAFGLRLPFSFRRIVPGRAPRPNELVVYSPPAGYGSGGQTLLGRVAPESAGRRDAPQNHYLLLAEGTGGEPDSRVFGRIPQERLLGSVVRVWWPLWRRRRIR